MARDLTSGMVAEFTASELIPFIMMAMFFDGGTIRIWNGNQELIWNGDAFIGAGNLIGINQVAEMADLQATGTAVTLSGISNEILAIAMTEPYQGRRATIWLGCFDKATGQIVADPSPIFKGRMDTMTIARAAETCTVSLNIENVLIDLERPRQRNFTTEDQAIDYPGDTFFDFVPGLQDKEIAWGRG